MTTIIRQHLDVYRLVQTRINRICQLAELAPKVPADDAVLLAINDVGKHKVKRFSSEFIDEIINYMCR